MARHVSLDKLIDTPVASPRRPCKDAQVQTSGSAGTSGSAVNTVPTPQNVVDTDMQELMLQTGVHRRGHAVQVIQWLRGRIGEIRQGHYNILRITTARQRRLEWQILRRLLHGRTDENALLLKTMINKLFLNRTGEVDIVFDFDAGIMYITRTWDLT